MIMWRVLFTLGGIVLTLLMPWWVVFGYGIIGIILFPWYLEVICIGLYFDTVFGIPTVVWYMRMMHTAWLVFPLIIVELIKQRINV